MPVGQLYGLRAEGPWDPAHGRRFNPEKLLLDPYARAVTGIVTQGPEVLAYDVDDPHLDQHAGLRAGHAALRGHARHLRLGAATPSCAPGGATR